MHKTPDRQQHFREIANALTARPPAVRPKWPIPIRARIVWADTGEEEWIDTVAAGWDGQAVRVDAKPLRPAYGFNYVWLDASDVQRRTIWDSD